MDTNTITMNVSLPEPLKRYVDGKVAGGTYGSASEFVREAIREKLQREQELEQARTSLNSKLRKALDNRKAVPFDAATYGEEKKRKLLARLKLEKERG